MRLNYDDEMIYLHHDHLGSAVAGTDANGDVLWTEKYTPFGIALVNDAANDNQAGYTGHLKDTDTGLTYMQARYYDPVIGRFLSHDPEGFMSQELNPMYFNRYMYTMNSPINAIDPDGRDTHAVFPIDRNGDTAHSAVIVDNAGIDKNGNKTNSAVPALYDPNGSREMIRGNGPRNVAAHPENTNIQLGENVNVEEYVRTQFKEYPEMQGVAVLSFKTSAADEANIISNALVEGPGGGIDCTCRASNAISGVGPIPDTGTKWRPNSLRKALTRSPNSQLTIYGRDGIVYPIPDRVGVGSGGGGGATEGWF